MTTRRLRRVRSTSLEALGSVDVDTLAYTVLQAIEGRGDATCDELEAALGLAHQTCSARVNELYEAGRIVDSGKRRMTRKKRRATVWRKATTDETAAKLTEPKPQTAADLRLEIERLTKERDEALAEVDRLTVVNLRLVRENAKTQGSTSVIARLRQHRP